MPLCYFKPDIQIATICEHCGTPGRETLARLYSQARLSCPACGHEHTPDRHGFRQTLDETEAMVASLPPWTEKAISRLHRLCNDREGADPPQG